MGTSSKNSQNPAKPAKKQIRHQNVLESLKSVGDSVGDSFKKDLLAGTSRDFMDQLFGPPPAKKYSGEMKAGESLNVNDVYSGKHEEEKKLQGQLALERSLRREEERLVSRKQEELRVQLKALITEVQKLAESTVELEETTKIATIQAPAEPGIYHVVFFEKLIDFIQSFRKKIEDASAWLASSNTRAAKKNYWAKYKKHGGKFLLAADHYLTRSAG